MLIEFMPSAEHCTAVITSHLDSGENFDGAIAIGYYPGSTEIWMQAQGVRVNIQSADVDVFCKQLKRAAKIAKDQS